MAHILGVSMDKLERAVVEEYNIGFKEYFKKYSADGKVSLRRKQYLMAQEGDVTMLKHLDNKWLKKDNEILLKNIGKATTLETIDAVIAEAMQGNIDLGNAITFIKMLHVKNKVELASDLEGKIDNLSGAVGVGIQELRKEIINRGYGNMLGSEQFSQKS
jgi:hypothetical protein